MARKGTKRGIGDTSLEAGEALLNRALAMLATGAARRPLPPPAGDDCREYEEWIGMRETLDEQQRESLDRHVQCCDHCLDLLYRVCRFQAMEEEQARNARVVRFPVSLPGSGVNEDDVRVAAAGVRRAAPLIADYGEKGDIAAGWCADHKERLCVNIEIDGQPLKGVTVRLERLMTGRTRPQVLAKGKTDEYGECVLGYVEQIRRDGKGARLQLAVRRPAKARKDRKR